MNVPHEIVTALSNPVVSVAEDISDTKFHSGLGFDSGQARCNLFVPPRDIFLMQNAKIHNLAHEFVHFFSITMGEYVRKTLMIKQKLTQYTSKICFVVVCLKNGVNVNRMLYSPHVFPESIVFR